MARSYVDFWVVDCCDYHSGTFPTSSGLVCGCCVHHVAICDDRVFLPTRVGEENLLVRRRHSPRAPCLGGFATGSFVPHVAAYAGLISNRDRCLRLAFDHVCSVACYRCTGAKISLIQFRDAANNCQTPFRCNTPNKITGTIKAGDPNAKKDYCSHQAHPPRSRNRPSSSAPRISAF